MCCDNWIEALNMVIWSNKIANNNGKTHRDRDRERASGRKREESYAMRTKSCYTTNSGIDCMRSPSTKNSVPFYIINFIWFEYLSIELCEGPTALYTFCFARQILTQVMFNNWPIDFQILRFASSLCATRSHELNISQTHNAIFRSNAKNKNPNWTRFGAVDAAIVALHNTTPPCTQRAPFKLTRKTSQTSTKSKFRIKLVIYCWINNTQKSLRTLIEFAKQKLEEVANWQKQK